MTVDNPSPFVPKLRFPEFRHGPRWDSLTLSSASDVNPSNDGLPELFIYIDLESVKSSMLIERKEITRDAAPSRAQRLLSRKDIIYQTVRPYQRNNLLFDINDGYEYVASTGYAQLRAHECPEFLYQLLHTDSFVNSVLARCAGSNFPAINPSALASIHVALPRKPEQQKIADCLGSLDDLIAAEGRKLEALRQHKQGLMQQLFPQPGETVPRLRFPEFREAGEWEEVTLGTLLDRPPDYGVNAPAVPFSESLPTYIRITDINDDGQFASRARVSVDIAATDEQYLEDGDIVLARTGASVGKSYRYREEDGRLVYAGFLIRVRPNPERLLSQFLAAYLSTWSYWDWVSLTSARSGQPGINATEYASIPLPLPPDRRTLAEQQKIADCLTSIDDQLNAQARKLDTLKQHKQGLLQQLFPSLDGQ